MKSNTYNNPLFLDNKYTACYYRIINRSKIRILEGYNEQHHILPRCMGGDNDESNITKLTAKEHFLCHMLLIKMTTGTNKNKMVWALQRFMNRNNKQKMIKVTSRQYEFIRKNYSKYHPMKSEFVKNNVKNTQFEKYGTYAFATEGALEIKKNASIKRYGVPYEFMMNPATLRNNAMILTCPHCNKIGKGLATMKRWHFDNCKSLHQ